MTTTRHCIVSRVAVKNFGTQFIDDQWLEQRLVLFQRYAAASLNAQTETRFLALLCFDVAVPDAVVSEFVGCLEVPTAVVRTADGWQDSVTEQVRSMGGGPLISTGLDSDDALTVDFVEQVQGRIAPDTALNFVDGLQRHDQYGLVVRRVKYANPFASMHSSTGDWVFRATGHKKLPARYPVVDVRSDPMWLQVVHGGNVANKFDWKGRTPQRGEMDRRFPFVGPTPGRLASAARRAAVRWQRRLGRAGETREAAGPLV
jgi:hypothetical protein